MDWSGVEIIFKATSTSKIEITLLNGNENEYNVFINDKLSSILSTTHDQTVYPIANNLTKSSEYTIRLTKRTEARFGIVTFKGIHLDQGGQILPLKVAHSRRIEFLGDSITCGYGDDSTDPNCKFTPQTENNYL
jgi:hypothetical protein